jgi:hypothetical protein
LSAAPDGHDMVEALLRLIAEGLALMREHRATILREPAAADPGGRADWP